MSELHGPIYAHLAANAGVSALVGSRIYRDRATETDVLPYITYTRISEARHPHSTGTSGLVNAVYQINSWATERNDANEIAEAVRNALDTLTGTLGAGAVTETTIRSCDLDASRDLDVPPTAGDQQGSDDGVAGVAQDYEFWYEETAPP